MSPHEMSQQEPSDGEIVRQVLDGSDDSYRILVRRYEDVLYRHAERMTGRPDEASDIVQDAFVKGYRKLRWCRDPENVGAWLYRIAVNLCKDYLKNRRRDNLSLEDAPSFESEWGDPDREFERGTLRQSLQDALSQLSPEQREAFLLKHMEDRSYTEMAEMLDASVSALKMRVHRARDELQKLLKVHR